MSKLLPNEAADLTEKGEKHFLEDCAQEHELAALIEDYFLNEVRGMWFAEDADSKQSIPEGRYLKLGGLPWGVRLTQFRPLDLARRIKTAAALQDLADIDRDLI